MIKSLLPIGFLSVISLQACAAPPVDLSRDEEKAPREQIRKQRLSENDLIFTGNLDQPEKTIQGLVQFKESVVGRSSPSPTGKPMLKFRKEYRARFLQYSQNKQWVAVELLNKKRRCWVPAKTVEFLGKEQN